MNIWKKVFNIIKSITKKDAVYIAIILLLVSFLCSSIKQCSDTRFNYKNNIEVLNDTIRYYKDKNGNLVATKLAFLSDVKNLKLLNESLYKQINDLKAKGKVTTGTYFSGVIENPKQDTTYIVKSDTIYKGFKKDFAFNNEYRILEGNVSYKNDTVGVNIEKDQVMFDYVVALDDKNNIMIRSNNPYVKYKEITGFQLPKERIKRWSLGAFGSYNYSPTDKFRYADVGIYLNYNISRFSIGPNVYIEHDFITKKRYFYIGGQVNVDLFRW